MGGPVAEAGELTPVERRRRVAAILAAGVVRVRQAAKCAGAGEISEFCGEGLEVVSKPRLSVSQRLAIGRRERESETIYERAP